MTISLINIWLERRWPFKQIPVESPLYLMKQFIIIREQYNDDINDELKFLNYYCLK